MNYGRKIVILSLLISIAGQAAISQNGKILHFFDGNTLHVRWTLNQNPEVTGYTVSRQAEGDPDWQILTPDPLRIITDKQVVNDRVGYQSALYFSLFGINLDSVRLTRQQVSRTLENPHAREFLEAMSLVNPGFGDLLGVMYHDTHLDKGKKYRYRVETVVGQDAQPWVETDWLTTDHADVVPEVSGLIGFGDDGRILLTWDKNQEFLRSGQVVTYRVFRADQLLGPFTPRNVFGILPVRVTSGENKENVDKEQFVDDYLNNGTTFFYYISAVNAFGFESDRSVTLEITTGGDLMPDSPGNLTGRLSGGLARIDWDLAGGQVDGYHVFRSDDQEADFSLIWPPDDLIRSTRNYFLDRNVREGQTYRYFVTSLRGAKSSKASDTISLYIPDFTPPAPPSGVVAEVINGGIRISWVPNTEQDILGYEMERASDTAFSKPFQLNALMISGTSYMDSISDRSPTTYGYRVYAFDQSYNRSEPSVLVKCRMPDIVPPQTPFITSFESTGRQVMITWTRCIDREFMEFRLYQRFDTAALQLADRTRENSYTFTLTEKGRYQFAVTAVDSAFNESPLSRVYAIDYSAENYPIAPERFKAVRNRDKHVQLTWEVVSGSGTRAYLLERTDIETGRTASLAEMPPDQSEFIDKRVLKGKSYTYSIRTLSNSWKMSPVVTAKITIR